MPSSTGSLPGQRRGTVGGGRVLMWRGGSLWVSRDTGPVQQHAHHAIQITLAPEQPVRLRSADAAEWVSTHASIVMPDKPHQFDGCGNDVVIVFVEPETTTGRMLVGRFGHAPLTSIVDQAVVAESLNVLRGLALKASDEYLIAGAKAIIQRLVSDVPETVEVDARITRALEWMRERLDTPITLAQVAAVTHLSSGRFRHLFIAQTGISFRAYILWTRVNSAMVTAMAGQSWTAAAQNAGFADSAHLTRTCKRMFGMAPTMLGRDERARVG